MKRLKTLRTARHLTQQQMADHLGVDRTTYTKYESGTNDPSIETIRSLASFFGVTTDYLLEHSDSPGGEAPILGLHVNADTPIEDMDDDQRAFLSDLARFMLHKAKQGKKPDKGDE